MKRFLKVSLLLTAMTVVLAGCSCYNKMAKQVGNVKMSATPEMLILKGDKVTADIKVEFPARFMNKKAIVRVTPVLVFKGGEIAGTPKFVQGEAVKDNYQVISTKNGGSYSQTVVFPYDSRAAISTLELRFDVKCCATADFMTFASVPVAQGISNVLGLLNESSSASIMPDNFKRVTTIQQDADIMYQINSAVVRPKALSDSQIKLLEEFVRENKDKDRVSLGNIQAKGYASPDGPVDFNDKLSKNRSNTGKDAVSKQLKDVNVGYDVAAYGEDWDGFKKLVEASNIPDKDLILQVLSLYSSPVQRDREIKNMSSVFDVLKKEILPQLRRTKMVASADIQGKTDAELRSAVKENINSLNVEELLFSATLFNDNATKATIYKKAAEKYNDARAYNNLGVVLMNEGNFRQAKNALQQAAKLSNDPAISNNLGLVALAEGKIEEAKKYLQPLNTADANANKALVQVLEGNTNAAAGLQGYNLAVAELANGNVARAKAALGNVATADADYLRGIIAMREGDTNAALRNLKSAVSKDKGLAARAKNDIEFAKLFANSEFQAL